MPLFGRSKQESGTHFAPDLPRFGFLKLGNFSGFCGFLRSEICLESSGFAEAVARTARSMMRSALSCIVRLPLAGRGSIR